MIIFDEQVVRPMIDLGYDVEPRSARGTEVSFVKGSHRIDVYLSDSLDNSFCVFSESSDVVKTEEGYYVHDAIGLTSEELLALGNILKKVERKLVENGG